MDFVTRDTRTCRNDIAAVIDGGPFDATWASLAGYAAPDWYENGKFGIFVHWGPYAVPAFGNEWYPRNMYLPETPEFAHHVATWGDQQRFGYKDFIPLFTAERFDADAWAVLFREAGAQFVVPVAEHHDGFAMYDCGFSPWNAVQMGPKRDIIGELAAAVRRHWMVFGLSSHRAEHWWFMNGGMTIRSDVQESALADFYGPAQSKDLPPNEQFLEDWLVRTCELVEKYEPHLVWFDWWIEEPVFAPYLREFAAFYYNQAATWRRGVAINHKYASFPPGTAVFDVERGQLAGIRPDFWQTDTSVARNSWGYVDGLDYKQPGDLIRDMIDIVSKNGALLLNIGPRADGTIPEEDQRILREIGAWLRINGEAIYGTRPWSIHGEGPTEIVDGAFTDTRRTAFTAEDIRFTRRNDTLFAIALAIPDARRLRITTLREGSEHAPGTIAAVHLVGAGDVSWERDTKALTVTLPDSLPADHAIALRITTTNS